MANIDTISKYLIQHYPDHFACFTLARDDGEVIEVIDTELPTVEARRADSFIRVRIGGEEALVQRVSNYGQHPSVHATPYGRVYRASY